MRVPPGGILSEPRAPSGSRRLSVRQSPSGFRHRVRSYLRIAERLRALTASACTERPSGFRRLLVRPSALRLPPAEASRRRLVSQRREVMELEWFLPLISNPFNKYADLGQIITIGNQPPLSGEVEQAQIFRLWPLQMHVTLCPTMPSRHVLKVFAEMPKWLHS